MDLDSSAKEIRKAVYFDENYCGTWIGDDASRRIASYLSKKWQFSIVKAEDLRRWMLLAVKEDFAGESVVVFAKDVAPSSVFDDESPNCVLRRYLDAGGRVVWLGDIPLFYKAHPGKKTPEERWQFLPFLSILGVQPLISWSYNPVTITKTGKLYGLKQAWYGNRPSAICVKYRGPYIVGKNLMPSAASRIQILAYSKPVLVKHLLKKENRWKWWFKGVSVAGYGVNVDFREPQPLYEWNKEFVNAWKVSFNPKHPNQGFIRIWDKVIHTYDLPDNTLDELNSVATWKLTN
jgi:hypothetical protein